MNALQNAQMQMSAVVKVVCDKYTAIWTGFPPFAAPYTDFDAALTDANAILARQAITTQGTTEVKGGVRTDLEAITLQVANGLVLYGTINNTSLKREAYTTPSMLLRFTEKELVGHAALLSALAAGSFTPPLTSVNVTAGDLTNLQTRTTAFALTIGKPRGKKLESSRGTKELAAIIDKKMALLEQMDAAAKVLQVENPDFYTEYIGAREITDPGYSTRQLSVSVREAVTGKGIKGVAAIINPGNIKKLSGATGAFYINNLPAGTYTAIFTNRNFQSTTKEFTIDANQATVVDVLLTPHTA